MILVAATVTAATLTFACGGGKASVSGGRATVAGGTPKPASNTTCTIARADIDHDGGVSILDLTKVAGQFGQRVPPAPRELDLDDDGAVTVLDLNLITGVFIRQVSECP